MKTISLSRVPPLAIAVLVAMCCLAVYRLTMLPGIGFIDSGELVAVSHTLGIAHPTGYPLFTMLGWIFCHLPFGGEEVWRLNVMASLLTSASLVFFFLSARMLVAVTVKRLMLQRELILAAAAGGTLVLGFSRTFWVQALAVEVYSLHLLLISLVLWLVLTAHQQPSGRWWMLAAYTLGLSFTNHMTTILLLPGVLYLYFAARGAGKESWRAVGRMVPVFLLGLSVYLYLPLRASSVPLLNWGNPVSLERLSWHLSGKQYRVWIFSSSDAAWRQLSGFLSGLPSEFAVIGLVLAVVGLVGLWRASRHLAYGLALLFVVCVAYAINYDIHDIDSYFLLAYCCVGLLAGVGLMVIGSWGMRVSGWNGWIVGTLVVAVGVIPLVTHYRAVDQSENYLVEDYTRNLLRSVKPGGVVFSYQWDYWVSASYTFQYVRGERTDVTVVDKELLRRSWYLTELSVRHPAFMERCRNEVEAFRKELYKFEHELPYDGAVIEARFVGMIRAMIGRSMASGPVYVTPEIEEQFTQGYQRVPEGLVFRVVSDTAFVTTDAPDFVVRPFGGKGRLESVVWQLYAGAYVTYGDYLLRQGRPGEARKAYKDGLIYDPSSQLLRARVAALGG